MKKRVLFWLLLASLGGVCTGQTQEVEPIFDNACDRGQPCDQVCNFDWTPFYEKVVRLHDLLEGTADYKTIRLQEILGTVDSNPTLRKLRETWYVRRESLPGQTGPLYRCKNAAIPDHRDSASSSEGAPAYNCFTPTGEPNVLANPWINSATASRTPVGSTTSGLAPLRRYVRSGGTDSKTWTSQTPSGYLLNTTFSGANARLGYERFGKLLAKAEVVGTGPSSGYGEKLDNGSLQVDFNRTWGNAIGRITHVPTGRQIVSEPIGDMVQSVVRFNAGDPDCRVPNPTQSGGAQCVAPNYSYTTRWAGSPVISTSRVGTAPGAPQTFTSVVRPLDFCHNGRNQVAGTSSSTPRWPGTTDTDPLIWNGFTERTDTLSCKLGTSLRKEVLRTVSRYQLAAHHTGSETKVSVLNTYWLKPKDLVTGQPTTAEWDFKIYCKNLETGAVQQILKAAESGRTKVGEEYRYCGAPSGANDDGAIAPRARHAIIATRSDGTFAYAVARLNVPPGGYTNVAFRCAAHCSDSTRGTVIIQAHTVNLQLSKTQWSTPQESFLVVGSKGIIMDSAVNRLGELNAEAITGGVSCLN